MELQRTSVTGADLSSEYEILRYVYSGDRPIEVIARADLGDADGPLSGSGGAYQANFYLDDVRVDPANSIIVPIGRTSTIFVSRPVPLEPGDVVSLRIQGQPDDLSVNVAATLRDSTPLRGPEVFGAGDIPVDHDYPTEDNLRVVTALDAGVPNAKIRAFLEADYSAGRRSSAYVRGQTTTAADGRWSEPLALAAGRYSFVVTRAGYGAAVLAMDVS
jgi:hypothetical protein